MLKNMGVCLQDKHYISYVTRMEASNKKGDLKMYFRHIYIYQEFSSVFGKGKDNS